MSKNSTSTADPCAAMGPAERRGVVWFFFAIIIGVTLSLKLASIDAWMYDNNAEVLDMAKYRENRLSATMLPSERIDERLTGSYPEAVERLNKVAQDVRSQ